MKRVVLILNLILLFSVSLFAEAPVIELETETVAPISGKSADSLWFDGQNVYQSGGGGTRFENIQTFQERSFDYIDEIRTILGTYDDNFLVTRWKEKFKDGDMRPFRDPKAYIDIYIYNPREESYRLLKNITGGTWKGDLKWLFHYHDQYFVGTRSADGSYDYGDQVLINSITGEEIIQDYDLMVDLSSDKLTGIYYKYGEAYYIKKVGEKNSIIGSYKELMNNDRNAFFITNDLFALQFDEDLRIFNLECELQVTFRYLIPEGTELRQSSFKKFGISQYGFFGYADTLIKAPDIYPYLDELGLLFHPTTAVLNDDRVRMREWPLLDAKHLAFLEEGEEVEVLDRSGIKVQIGDMNDYWYKIKRADGTEGWSYGYFLDLAEEE